MPIPVVCECGERLSAPDEAAGKYGRCPRCRARLAISKPSPKLVVPFPEEGRHIVAGLPGEAWVNDTGKPKWQLFVVVHADYARCFQHWSHLANYWPVPHVDGCECTQRPVKPGATAEPFVDLSAELAKLGAPEQDALMGRCNWILFQSGVAKWPDVVTRGRIREFPEVMDRLDLTVDRMVEAGVPEADARAAWDLVHTPEREAIDAQRRDLFRQFRDSGLTNDQIVEGVADRLGRRLLGEREIP
jgi:hypothetical protein